MAKRDITIYSEDNGFGYPGTGPELVESGDTTIESGEPVAHAKGQPYGSALATAKPVVGTDYLSGIAQSESTQTAEADGKCEVLPVAAPCTYLCNPVDPTQWDTQAKYDALVGARVVFTITDGHYLVGHTDGSTNGLVVEPLDIAATPNKVRFSLDPALNYKG